MNLFKKIKYKIRNQRDTLLWHINGRPVPPPHIVKQRILTNYAEVFNIKTFVETGTYYGDMLEALKYKFNLMYSIELSVKLYSLAKKRFKNDKFIKLINGDSATKLNQVLDKLSKKPTLFWLDGHYSAGVTAKGSKETPIIEELQQIFENFNEEYVIIIDDARCFGIDPSYPSIEYIIDYIKKEKPLLNILVKNDLIRITPKKICPKL
tara:strand:+ start:278 stop:901 length:624 start_codon:yes stop_codon:yes gene_type:complete